MNGENSSLNQLIPALNNLAITLAANPALSTDANKLPNTPTIALPIKPTCASPAVANKIMSELVKMITRIVHAVSAE